MDQNVLDQIQKSIRPPPTMNLEQRERSIPLVVAVADAARNPRIRGKPSRLRDLQQPVPMEENPEEPIIQQRYVVLTIILTYFKLLRELLFEILYFYFLHLVL